MRITVFRYVKRSLVLLLTVIFLYFAIAIILSLISTKPEPLTCSKNKVVYVWSNGVHLDLILPRELLSSELRNGLDLPTWVKFIAFGWGDMEFYINTPTWADLKSGPTFRALFSNSQSAMHVVWLSDNVRRWVAVPLCEVQLQQIREYIENTFDKDKEGRLQEVFAAGYTDRDRFYLARGSFSFIHTCNNWVNNALKAAEVKTSIWSPFDKGVLYQLRNDPAGE